MSEFPTEMYGKSRREHILDGIEDLFANWLYYDRKECDYLPRGSIEDAVAKGEITKQEILNRFVAQIERNL